MYKLQATVRGGSSNSPILSKRFATVEDARTAAKHLMHENGRIVRVTVVTDAMPSSFVEWIERA